MKRLKKFLPSSVLKILYDSLVLPYINYGILTWGKNIKRINKLQKWAVRTIYNSKYNAHTDPLLKKLKSLKATDIYKLSALKLCHKYNKNASVELMAVPSASH